MQNYYPKLQEKQFPIIDLGDFYLREKQESDVEDFFAYYSLNPNVNRYILCSIPQTIDEAKRELMYWRGVFYRNQGIYFAIADKKTGKLIGTIGLTSYNSYQSRIEISYDLAEEYWGRGITTTAIGAVVKHALDYWKVNRIEAFVSTSNIPSKNLLLKCGFTLEGILRQHRYHLGRYVDVYSFSLLRSDLV